MKIDGIPDGPKRVYKGTLPYPGYYSLLNFIYMYSLVVTRALGMPCI